MCDDAGYCFVCCDRVCDSADAGRSWDRYLGADQSSGTDAGGGEYASIVLQNAFLDFKLSADKVRVNNLSGARFSMLLPGRAGISGSTVSFVNDTTSGIYVYKATNGNQELWSLKTIGRLSASVGGTRGTTEIGYEAGGVFRGDNGHMVWITPGLIEIYPDAKENRTINVEIVMPVFSGNPSISSNWGVPLNCLYHGYKDIYRSEKNLTIGYSIYYSKFIKSKRGTHPVMADDVFRGSHTIPKRGECK